MTLKTTSLVACLAMLLASSISNAQNWRTFPTPSGSTGAIIGSDTNPPELPYNIADDWFAPRVAIYDNFSNSSLGDDRGWWTVWPSGLSIKERMTVECPNDTATHYMTGTMTDGVVNINNLPAYPEYAIGAISRGVFSSQTWSGYNNTKGTGAIGIAGVVQHNDAYLNLATQPNNFAHTGFIRYASAGQFTIVGDNSHFYDQQRAGAYSASEYSMKDALVVDANYNSGYCNSKDQSGTQHRWGALINNLEVIRVGSKLNGDASATSINLWGSSGFTNYYDPNYDAVQNYAGIHVKAPTKVVPSGVNNTAYRQEVASRAYGANCTGLLIDAPNGTGNGTVDSEVSPAQYVGLKSNAKVEFNGGVTIGGTDKGTVSVATGTAQASAAVTGIVQGDVVVCSWKGAPASGADTLWTEVSNGQFIVHYKTAGTVGGAGIISYRVIH